ncbi:MAG: type I DNA topoisomerase [Patescibacteria group bacterium]
MSTTKKKLVIVESPAKARTIGQYLGPDFTVRASFGHVRDLPKNKLSIETDNHFAVTYQNIPRAKKILEELKKELAGSSELYLAPDPDREGEAIAWHLVAALKPKVPVHRISFTEITKPAVQHAVAHPRQISKDLVDAQQARRILDRLVGYKLSPLLWKKVYRGLSAGRVQSVAVRLIVEREREIKAFKPRDFWTISAEFTAKSGSFSAYIAKDGSTAKQEFSSKEDVDKVVRTLKTIDFTVGSINTAASQLRPAAPLITSTLQQNAARFFGFSAKRTMRVAQDLYEGVDVTGQGTVGLITYMRTDSHNISEIARKEAAEMIAKSFGAKYLPERPNIFSKKVKGAQEAHEAIRPTHFSLKPADVKNQLSGDQFKIYSLIYNTAAASQMAPADVETTTSIIAGGKYNFIARGRQLVFDGFLTQLPADDERFEPLPSLNENEKLKLKKIADESHSTEPPARYSEATLVRELEKRGIGRPSTYAPIMSTIVDRGYITKQTGRFFPEDVANIVTDLLVENFPTIIDYDFTAQMEDQLDEIADGRKELEPVLNDFYAPFAKLLAEKEKTIEKKTVVEETDKTCPKCGKPVVIKLGRFGKFYACSGFPECDYSAPIIADGDKKIEQEVAAETKEPCPDCGGTLGLKQSRFGPFIGCSNYPKCKYTKSIKIGSGVMCPNCGKELVRKNTRKGKVFWGCSGYPSCKTAFWDEPTGEKCPQCQGVMVKKKSGLVCSQCKFAKDDVVAPEPAESVKN